MGAAAVKPPPGFTIDSLEPEAPPLPEGFAMDAAPRRSPREMAIDPPGLKGTMLGLTETALSMGSGLAASIGGGYAGIAGSALPGPPGQGADWARRTQEAATYQPRTQKGETFTDVASFIPRKIGEGADYVGGNVSEASGSPALGTAANIAIQAIPAILSRAARGRAQQGLQNVATEKSRNALKDDTLRRAQAEGYVTEASDGPVGTASTILGGKTAIKQQAAHRNQEVTNKIARREAGLAEDQPITAHTLEKAREQMSEPYRQVSAMSPIAKKALEDLKIARSESKAWHKFYERSFDPRVLKKASDFDKKADGLETKIDRIAQGSKNPNLLAELREARTKLAKNHEVERAMNQGTGDVDARYLGNRLDAGVPMTGGLETIGRFAQGQGFNVTRDASRVGMVGATHPQLLESVIGGVEGGRHFGLKGAILGAGVPLLRIPARSMALSKLGQPGPTSAGLGLKLMDVGSRPTATGAAALSPGLGLQPPREDY